MVRPERMARALVWVVLLGAVNAEHLKLRIFGNERCGPLGRPFLGRFSQDHLDLTVKMADLVS